MFKFLKSTPTCRFSRIRHSSVEITSRAARQLSKVTLPSAFLRVQVDAGGCHGYQYKMELTHTKEPDDVAFEKDGQTVLVDPLTLDMIQGSKIDYVDELIGSSFQVVDNPKAESSCGCKVSFNIKE